MSSFAVTVEELKILEHPGADALELAQVGGYRAVVRKGAFQSGDLACYIPEQAILPQELIEELGLVGRLAGSNKDRVKAVRLRGELSQGIVFVPAGWTQAVLSSRRGENLAAEFGVTKWVPEVPAHFGGDAVAEPDLVPMTDIENIKRYPGIFREGEEVVATEKLHGTCSIIGVIDGRVVVSSKGMGSKRLGLAEDTKNLYWKAAIGGGVGAVAAALADELGARRVFLYGEIFGRGVQDLDYGADVRRDDLGYRAFDLWVEVDGVGRFLDPAEFEEALEGRLQVVPVIYRGPYAESTLWDLAGGVETVSGQGRHIREGIVVRAAVGRIAPETGERAIAKFVSDEYLLRGGGTEFE